MACLFIALTWMSWQKWRARPMHPRDGQIAEQEPVQTDVKSAPTVNDGRWTLTPPSRLRHNRPGSGSRGLHL